MKPSKQRDAPLYPEPERTEPNARPGGLNSERWPLWLVFLAFSPEQLHTDGSKGVQHKILECFQDGGEVAELPAEARTCLSFAVEGKERS